MKKGCIFAIVFLLSFGWAKEVTDQLGRVVQVPDQVKRAVVLQHQTLDIAVQLNATSQIVGILSSWKKRLGKTYEYLAPELKNMPTPGDLNSVNLESLLALKPDVVFVTNYMPTETINLISQHGIPVIAISFFVAPSSQQKMLNPTLEDENYSYTEGLKEAITLIANVFNHVAQGKELIDAAFSTRKLLIERLGDIPQDKRVRVYMANPDLATYGSGKYIGLMMQYAGAMNVASATIKGHKQVSLENVLQWNPQVIFVQSRYAPVVNAIYSDQGWKEILAVKNHQVFLMPEYVKAWGHPTPEAMALGELWIAKKLYPQKFEDINLDKLVNDYYLKFYNKPYISVNQR